MADTHHQLLGWLGSRRKWWPARSNPAPQILKPYVQAQRRWYVPGRAWLLTGLLLLFCLIYGFAFAVLSPFLITPFTIPIILLLLLLIWAMPDATAPVRTMNFFFFAFFIGLIAWPNYLSIALPGLPWISIIRLTIFPFFLLFLYSLSVSHEFRATLSDTIASEPVLWKLLIAFTALQTLSVGLSKDPIASLGKLVVSYTEWIAVFFGAAFLFLKPGRAMRWAACMWGLAIWICAIGLLENRLGFVPWRDHIPSFLKIDPMAEAAMAGTQRSALGIHRVQGTFTTSLALAEFLALSLPFVIHFLRAEFKFIVRAAAAITIPTIVYVIVVSQSRLGLVGSIVTLLASLFIWAYRKRLSDKKNPFWTGIVVGYPVIFAVIIASTFFVGRIHAMVWGNGPQQFSDQSRIEQFHMGLPKILTHPWGYGIGMGGDALGFADLGGFITIDSYYLVVGLEYGVIGFVLFFGIFFWALFLSGKQIASPRPLEREHALLIPVGVALLNFVVIKGVFAQQDNQPLIFMLLGMLAALLWRIKVEPQETPFSARGKIPATQD